MIEFPKSCLVNKFIPKKVFYEKATISSKVKEEFINKIEKITWSYKLSEETLNINSTEAVKEIQFFEIKVKEKYIPKNILITISKSIPYKIIFILRYSNDFCYAVYENNIFTTEWNKEIEYNLNQLNIEIVYNDLLKKILNEEYNKKTIENIIDNKQRMEIINSKINKLKTNIKIEKQFNRKIELNKELHKLEKEMEELINE